MSRSVRRKKKILEFVRQFKADSVCKTCGTKEDLTFHHRDPSTKKGLVRDVAKKSISFKQTLAEIAKCDILCRSCHDECHQ